MEIKNIEGLTVEDIQRELRNGARFVVYEYCISLIFMSLKYTSDIYFIRTGESGVSKGLGYSLISLIVGWWGVPWGPIYTFGSLITNFSGGKNVTEDILATMNVRIY